MCIHDPLWMNTATEPISAGIRKAPASERFADASPLRGGVDGEHPEAALAGEQRFGIRARGVGDERDASGRRLAEKRSEHDTVADPGRDVGQLLLVVGLARHVGQCEVAPEHDPAECVEVVVLGEGSYPEVGHHRSLPERPVTHEVEKIGSRTPPGPSTSSADGNQPHGRWYLDAVGRRR